MTSEYYKLKDGTQASVFELMPTSDAQSSEDIKALKSRMMAKFEEYKNGSADEISKLGDESFCLSWASCFKGPSNLKIKAILR